METKTIKKNSDAWVVRDPDAKPVEGYDAELEASLARGIEQLDAGQGIPAEQAWKELGIE